MDGLIADRNYSAAKAINKSQINAVAEAAFAAAKLYRDTGDAKYADFALANLAAIRDAWRSSKSPGKHLPGVDDFFLPFPLFSAYRLLDEAGKIDATTRDEMKQVAVAVCAPVLRGNFNRPMARATGQALAAKLFPDVPESSHWRKSAEDVWNDWYAGGDTTENALNYNAIFVGYAFELADLLGHTNDMAANANVRAMYERFRDQVSPSGITAGYGDSAELDDWPFFVAGFERAAATWHDPTLRWAAVQMFDAGMRLRPPGKSKDEDIRFFFPLALAEGWADASLTPEAPKVGTAVLTRREPRNPRMPDKLVLAPSREPGAPFLLCDDYAGTAGHAFPQWGGMHSHPQWGSIAYFEAGGEPVLHSLGYNNRSPAHANLLLVTPPSEPFPYGRSDVQPGKWTEARLPLRALAPISSGDARRNVDSITLRVECPQALELSVKDVRLVGPAGEQVIDDFAGDKLKWRSGEATSLKVTTDPTDGRRELVVSCPGAKPDGSRPITFIASPKLDETVDLSKFSEIRFSWMLSRGDPKWARPFIVRVDHYDFQVPLPQLFATPESATADSLGGDCYGRMSFGDWFADGAQWTRRLLLSREGVLLVRDEFTPAAGQEDWTAAPIWHLFSPPTKGANWFDAAGDARFDASRRTMVWFAPGHGQTVDSSDVELWGGYHPYTVFARQSITGVHPVSYLTLIVPHDASETPAELARGISAAQDGDGVDIRMKGADLHLSFGEGDKWSASRGESTPQPR